MLKTSVSKLHGDFLHYDSGKLESGIEEIHYVRGKMVSKMRFN